MEPENTWGGWGMRWLTASPMDPRVSMDDWPVHVTRVRGGYLAVKTAEIRHTDSRGRAYPRIPWIFIGDDGCIFSSWRSERNPEPVIATLNPPDPEYWQDSREWTMPYCATQFEVLKAALKIIGREDFMLLVDERK